MKAGSCHPPSALFACSSKYGAPQEATAERLNWPLVKGAMAPADEQVVGSRIAPQSSEAWDIRGAQSEGSVKSVAN